MNLYPSILTDSLAQAQKEVMFVASFPKIRNLQIDIIDGQFADNITITPSDLLDLDVAELTFDLHLMTEEPLDYVYEALDYKDHLPIRGFIGQLERMTGQEAFLETVKKENWQAGLSLDLYTPLESIDDSAWQHLDIVQLMSIEAGYQGQDFNKSVLKKIKELQQIAQKHNRDVEIIIDGGIKPDIADRLETAKVDSIVVGSGLWKADDISQAVTKYLD